MENITVPSQDGEPVGRGVDLNQLKLDLITSEPQRLKQRIFRIDIDLKTPSTHGFQQTVVDSFG
jgi:hypothetical protein